jgi:predicted nucleic acid-binding protein
MLLDTDVMVDFLRGHAPAVAWLTASPQSLGLPGLVAVELVQGSRNMIEQQRIENELRRFSWYWPTPADCQRAYQDFSTYHLSHHLGLLDALVAHTAVGLQEPLATFNVKHYGLVASLRTIQPY